MSEFGGWQAAGRVGMRERRRASSRADRTTLRAASWRGAARRRRRQPAGCRARTRSGRTAQAVPVANEMSRHDHGSWRTSCTRHAAWRAREAGRVGREPDGSPGEGAVGLCPQARGNRLVSPMPFATTSMRCVKRNLSGIVAVDLDILRMPHVISVVRPNDSVADELPCVTSIVTQRRFAFGCVTSHRTTSVRHRRQCYDRRGGPSW